MNTSTAPRIAIFRALQLGDMLCCVPGLRTLRQHYLTAHIALVGLPWAQSFVDRYAHLLDELIVFPGAVGFPEQRETDEYLPAFSEHMRARRFDLALQLHGSGGVANEIVGQWGALITAGFRQPEEVARPGVFVPWPDDLPEPARYDALMQALGCAASDLRLEIPLTAQDLRECDSLMQACGLDTGRLILVHAGAQLPSRRWPVERFAQVASVLCDAGWQIAITGSSGEAALTSSLAAMIGTRAIDLTGRTSLGALAALVARARLIVCNDTGLSHVAAAMQTPSVVIASGSDTHRWAPLDRERHRVLADYPPCRPCAFRECPYRHPCALAIDARQVIHTALMQLDRFAIQPLKTTYAR
jgi:ADP-heptose:LPS heptosyltransferase